jgi:hypothetical protein
MILDGDTLFQLFCIYFIAADGSWSRLMLWRSWAQMLPVRSITPMAIRSVFFMAYCIFDFFNILYLQIGDLLWFLRNYFF